MKHAELVILSGIIKEARSWTESVPAMMRAAPFLEELDSGRRDMSRVRPDPRKVRQLNEQARQLGFELNEDGTFTGDPDISALWTAQRFAEREGKPLWSAPGPNEAGPGEGSADPVELLGSLSPEFQEAYWLYLQELINNNQRGPLGRAFRKAKPPWLEPFSAKEAGYTGLMGLAGGALWGGLRGGAIPTKDKKISLWRVLTGAGIGGGAGYMAGTHLPAALEAARGSGGAWVQSALDRENALRNPLLAPWFMARSKALGQQASSAARDGWSTALPGILGLLAGGAGLHALDLTGAAEEDEND